MLEAAHPTDKPSQADWEETMYPTAPKDVHLLMREQRGMIRAFLASPFGRTEAIKSDGVRRTKRIAN